MQNLVGKKNFTVFLRALQGVSCGQKRVNCLKNPYLEGVSLAFPYLERRKAIFIDCVVFGTNVKNGESAS